MRARSWFGMASGLGLLLCSSWAQAQCSMDTECQGDRVCENGQCVELEHPVPPAEGSPSPAVSAAPAPVLPPPVLPPPLPPIKVHRSKGMMVGGIVITALAPASLLFALVADAQKMSCDLDNEFGDYQNGRTVYPNRDCSGYEARMYGGLVAAVAFVAVGVPMIVIGAKRVTVDPNRASAQLGPWVTPTSAGLSLKLDM